jgi:predicted enzyme related to lactoylglutathione lyase
VLADAEGNEFCVWPGSRRDDGALYAISLDVEDAAATGRFWRSAAGWPIVFEGNRGDEHTVMLQSPDRNGPLLTVSGPPPDFEPKRGKNRVHLDVAPYAGDDQDADVERLVALGARRIDIGQGEVSWVVMADPEGNEFCVLTPR